MKEKLHRLVDVLPESDLHTAEKFLEYLVIMARDPVPPALVKAPVDDEPETEEGRQAVAEAREDLKAERVVSHEEARRRLLGR